MNAPFRVVVADPPWRLGDKLPGKKRGAAAHYATMKTEDIAAYLGTTDVQIADDALLFLWRVSAMQEEALRVVRAWGFVPKSEFVWNKKKPSGARHMGMGRYCRLEHESCIIASRGQGRLLIRDHGVSSTFDAPVGVHSEKPAVFFSIVERLASGPMIELFARGPRLGWTTMGFEASGANAKIPLGKEIDEALGAGRGGLTFSSAVARICGRMGFLVTVADVNLWTGKQMDEVQAWLEARCKRSRPAFLEKYAAGRMAAE